MSKEHYSAYDEETTARCERALVTLLGDIGPWGNRIYLAGGLAPRYIVGSLPEGARPHVGTTDVDLVIGLTVNDQSDEAYRTLENNLRKSGFEPENSFRWSKQVDGVAVIVEFMCETDQVEAGRIFKPKQGLGAKFGAFNVRGAQLIAKDFTEQPLEADRLDDGGRSRVTACVANILVYTVLKILAFQDRHENKDAYDLIYCLLNFGDGPRKPAERLPIARSTTKLRSGKRCVYLPSGFLQPMKTAHMPMPTSSPKTTIGTSRPDCARKP